MKFLGTQKMMKTMNKIEKIWFDGEWLYGLGDDGKTYRQSLLWYKNLLHATQEQRQEYEISTIGIHWRKLVKNTTITESYKEAVTMPFSIFTLTSEI